jgi:hypothetical protein
MTSSKLKRWGYVFWDKSRFKELGLLDVRTLRTPRRKYYNKRLLPRRQNRNVLENGLLDTIYSEETEDTGSELAAIYLERVHEKSAGT